MTGTFRAFVAARDGDRFERGVRQLSHDDLPDGDITVRVAWSGVNYKDALAATPDGKVAKTSPLVVGIDLAGEVTGSADDRYPPGTPVLVHGYDLGVSWHGGLAEYARVPADWVVALPDGLSARQAMTLGTAGFTAALSVDRLEAHGLTPAAGPVLVTGATGGVGSVAVAILAARGYEAVASTGKDDQHDWLRQLGAADVVGREEVSGGGKPLERQRWAGAIDCVGGATLPGILRTLRYGAAVAASGLTGGVKLDTTVLPFILRAVSLYGVDSVACPIQERTRVWQRLATDLRPGGLNGLLPSEVDLDGVEPVLDALLEGRARGRTVVRVTG